MGKGVQKVSIIKVFEILLVDRFLGEVDLDFYIFDAEE